MLDSIHGYYPQPLLGACNDKFSFEQELTSNILSKHSVQRYGKGWHAKLAPVSPVWGAPTLLLSDLFDPWQLCFWYHTSGVFTSWLVAAYCIVFLRAGIVLERLDVFIVTMRGRNSAHNIPTFNGEVQMYFLHVFSHGRLRECKKRMSFICTVALLKKRRYLVRVQWMKHN